MKKFCYLGILILASLNWGCSGISSSHSQSSSSSPTLSSLQITPAAISLSAGTTQQFHATAQYSDGSTKDMTSSVQWSSSNANVVLMSGSGLATAVAAGNVTIAAWSGSVSKSMAVTVTPSSSSKTLTSIAISPATASLSVNGAQQFVATGTYSDGSSADLTSSVSWSSSNSSVSTISAAGLAVAIAAGNTTITAQSGAANSSVTLTVAASDSTSNLKSIAISPAATSIPVNTSQQFLAIGTYNDGSSADITNLVSWSSSNPAITAISANGLASAISSGTTTISASFDGVSQSTSLAVIAPTISSITVSPVGLTLGIGINQQFVATAIYSDGSSADLNSGVTWSSSDTSVASVDANGLASTLATGSCTITATVGTLSDDSDLTVVAAHLISISLTPANPSIAQGTVEQFTATGLFDDGSTQELTAVAWNSSASAVASVNNSGLASGLGTGTTTITAASGSVSGAATLTVTGATLVSIAVTPANSSMPAGTTKQLVATGSFSDGSTQDVSGTVLWSSSSPSVVTIANSGLATGVATGNTTITATAGSLSGSTGLTVSTAHLVGISISPANPRVSKRTLVKFVAKGTFSDGSVGANLAGVSWKSSKPSIANVRTSGTTFAKKVGSVTIAASASGMKGTTTLTIGSGTLVSIAITPATATCSLGSTQQFTATGTFSDGSTQDLTLNSHWSSSVSSVATIVNGSSVAGQASCLGAGSSAIGANSKGNTSSAVLSVQ